MEINLPRTEAGVSPVVILILGRRGVGKTRIEQALAPLVTSDRRRLAIVSPIVTLKQRMPDVPWYQVTVTNKKGIEKLFRNWLKSGEERFVLCDEGDELTAANAAGTAGGFVAQAVYDYINYGREQGLGIAVTTRRPQNIAKDVCANANLVFVGNTSDPASLDYYSAWMEDPLEPDFDWRMRCRLLKDHYFMVWSPVSGQKFLGYVTVDMATMDLKPVEEEEALGIAPDAASTETSTTTDTSATAETSANAASGAASAEPSSSTAPEAPTAPTVAK